LVNKKLSTKGMNLKLCPFSLLRQRIWKKWIPVSKIE